MDFTGFVKEVYRDEAVGAKPGELQRLGRALDRAGNLEVLLGKNDPALLPFSAEKLSRLADAHRDFLAWKVSAKALRRQLSADGLSLPDGSHDYAYTPQELRALGRVAKICGRSGHADHDDWAQAVRAHLDLFRSCMAVSYDNGSADIRVLEPGSAAAVELEPTLAGPLTLKELAGLAWLSIDRGEKGGVLAVTLEIPWDEIRQLAATDLPRLGLAAEKQGVDLLVEQLFRGDLAEDLRVTMNALSTRRVVDAARGEYMSLLATEPLPLESVMALYTEGGDDQYGLAVLDRKGDVVAHEELKASDGLAALLQASIESHQPKGLVVQASLLAGDGGPLVVASAASLSVHPIDDTSVAQARQKLSFGPLASSAVVLGRRLLKPGREWGRVDPLSLDIGRFCAFVPAEDLREILTEAKFISSWSRRQKKSPRKRSMGRRSARAANAAALRIGLNESIKSIRDVRAGMLLDGIITNTTRFGAFVNIGLPVEGMIHISQLSIEFVESPGQVVQIGQKVKVRVLEVVPEKERIALSLKQAVDYSVAEGGTNGNGLGGPKSRREPPKSRQAALADLDALFNKKES